jgi:DNA-binding SARP family transcriptional activator
MEFRILGSLEVVHDERRLALRGAKQRAVVGLLALNSPKRTASNTRSTSLPAKRSGSSP